MHSGVAAVQSILQSLPQGVAEPAYAPGRGIVWRPSLSFWHAVCRSCSFPMLCPICQAKPEPKCGPCSKRQAALAAARKPAVTRTSLHRMSALFTWRSKGCKVFSLHCSETHAAACLGSAHCILLGTVRVILSASLIPLRLQVEVNLMQSRR